MYTATSSPACADASLHLDLVRGVGFAKRGLAVAVNYSRSEKKAKETLEEVKSQWGGGDSLPVRCRRRS